MNELIILKLGGSVITKKSEEKAEVSLEILKRLAAEIFDASNEKEFSLVVVHGAGPFGHVPAKRYNLGCSPVDERQIKGFSVTHQSMEKLNHVVVECLRKAGLDAVSFQPSAVGVLDGRQLVQFPTQALEAILSLGLVPVSYGDVLADKRTGIGILSGDHLVPYLAKKLKASRVIIATDVEGIFDSDPKENKNARLMSEVTSRNIKSLSVGNSVSTDITGGMARKVQELMDLAGHGVDSEIISALEPGLVKRALLGETGLGTVIKR